MNRLEDRNLVELGDAAVGIQAVARLLAESFAAGAAIELEARQNFVRANGREPADDELLEQVRAIAADRNFTL
ncbi:MAG: hypothetical protein WA208_12040 [Thermoanaerobaculia bacterium]